MIEQPVEISAKLQLGAGVGSKNFRRAVDRNRIRRLTKEAWRLQKSDLQEKLTGNRQLAVFLLYTSKEIENYQLISEKIKKIIDKLSVIVTETT